MKKKIIIIAILIVLVLAVGSCFFIFKNGGSGYLTEQVSRRTVIKEVSETGAVKVSEKVNLGFKYSGRIDEIYVKTGDEVSVDQNLAKLDTSQAYIELSEANAALSVAQADYNRLLAGSSEEEIKVAETEVNNAQVVLDNAKQNLEDVKADAEEDLNQAYEDAVDDLDDAYLKIYNAYNDVSDLQTDYFTSSDQESLNVKTSKSTLSNGVDDSKDYIDEAKVDYDPTKIETALSGVKEILSKARNALEVARNMTETTKYKDTVSSADKTGLDNHKSYINTAYTNITSARQTISTTKITNQTNINTAEATVASAEVSLQKYKDQLELKKAGPTQETINLYLAKIEQAQASVSFLNNKIQESTLVSPLEGQITDINKRKGETIQPTDHVVSLLPLGQLQVEVDIYEEDIVEVKEGNKVNIVLPAFPDETLRGKVVSIDPAEKLIGGVVYYEVNIIFEEELEGIKPGMTADIAIQVEEKENVIAVPKEALKRRDGNRIVRVLMGNKIEEIKVEIGIEGDDYVEIASGLEGGEEIIIREEI